MASVKEALAASASITITLDSLASSQTVGRASTAVDNTANLYLDALCQLKLVIPAGTPANFQTVYVYGYGSVDGTNFSEGITGTDAGYTIDNPTGLPMLCSIPVNVGGITRYSRPFSVAAGFGGMLPPKWGLVVVNYTGLALSTGNTAVYAGLTATVA